MIFFIFVTVNNQHYIYSSNKYFEGIQSQISYFAVSQSSIVYPKTFSKPHICTGELFLSLPQTQTLLSTFFWPNSTWTFLTWAPSVYLSANKSPTNTLFVTDKCLQ